MRILFLYPDAGNRAPGAAPGALAEPLALEYLAAGAIADGHEVRVLDLRLHPDQLDHVLASFCPEVAAVTAYSLHVPRSLEICLRVKSLIRDCRTVVGGHHATLLPEDFFVPQVDFVVRGEGVQVLRGLLRSLESNSLPRTIGGGSPRARGVVFDELHNTESTIGFEQLPDRTLVAEDRPRYFIDWMKPIALVRTAVGCPFRCTFCSLWRITSGAYRTHEIATVLEDLRAVPERDVFLVDDEPFINVPRMTNLAREIQAAGIKKRYFAYCRIDTFLRNTQVITNWREIGLERLFFGLEAIDDRELVKYKKGVSVCDIEQALRLARALGIRVFASFIVGTWWERRDFDKLIRFIYHHDVEYPAFTVWTPLPGTQSLDDMFNAVDRAPNGRPDWGRFDLQTPVVKTRLPYREFMGQFGRLRREFQDRYTQYRRCDLQSPDQPSWGVNSESP